MCSFKPIALQDEKEVARLNTYKMLNEKKRLEQEIKSIDLEMKKLPQKKFYCAKNGKNYKWYESVEGVGRYIPKKRRSYAEKLARYKYLQALRQDITKQIKAINTFLKYQNSENGLAQKMLENEAYAELLKPYVKTMSEELLEWQNASYSTNPLFPEALVCRTKANVFVRSKSEAMIASMLFSRKIPFHYEELLLVGDDSYYPDFTIKHPITGEIYYWEHLGMMDDLKYVHKNLAKLQHYAMNGIVLGVNLIITYETKEHPLDILQVERTLECYFEL